MAPKSKKKQDDDDLDLSKLTGIQDLEVPKSTIVKIAKQALPEGAKLGKDIPAALVRATTVFVSYYAAISHDVASERSHKTITANHVLESLKVLEWPDRDDVLAHMQAELKEFRKRQTDKKSARNALRAEVAAASQDPTAFIDPSLSNISIPRNAMLDTDEEAFDDEDLTEAEDVEEVEDADLEETGTPSTSTLPPTTTSIAATQAQTKDIEDL